MEIEKKIERKPGGIFYKKYKKNLFEYECV